MDRLNDASLMARPHPVRIDAVLDQPMDSLVFETAGVMPALKPYLTDGRATTEWILKHVPGMYEIAESHFGLIGGANMGSFILTMVRARLRAHGDPIVQVTPALQAMLTETDLAAELPAGFFRSPYPMVYIELARPNTLQVANKVSGLHECEGAYIGTYELPAGHGVFHNAARNRALNLDPAKPVRVIEVVITGSPIGKANALDDASQDIVLLVQDEDECLRAVLDRHIAWFHDPVAYAHPGMAPLDPDDVALVKPVIEQLAKVLLYLNLTDAEKLRVTERSDLLEKIRGLGPKKAAKFRRRMAGAYDRIVIGPAAFPEPEEPAGTGGGGGEAHRSIKAHWRRGHFRTIRYGEALSKRRLGWIKPVLVNAGQAFGGVKAKAYVVR
ncbi:hypothetical protein F2Q65_17320 [Thiohalocapsa marina]|uniref:Uncharacterized protein n=1 Tax=Thiohalocapsa marina TaxID=424902 RepID=A0A5M8FP89_9GAMM|nr:hypothetical protein [Thiohalocapsa marina]KAA6182732.1 hypothetical protein F2Q65_17320 [Thiohalocapsa marina]